MCEWIKCKGIDTKNETTVNLPMARISPRPEVWEFRVVGGYIMTESEVLIPGPFYSIKLMTNKQML